MERHDNGSRLQTIRETHEEKKKKKKPREGGKEILLSDSSQASSSHAAASQRQALDTWAALLRAEGMTTWKQATIITRILNGRVGSIGWRGKGRGMDKATADFLIFIFIFG